MLEGLEDVRAQLDEVDQRIVNALVERDRLVMEVARARPRRATARFATRCAKRRCSRGWPARGRRAGLDGFYVTRVFRELLDHSVRLQQEFLARQQNPERASRGDELVVAYQGVDGAYSHLAAMRHFGPRGGDVAFRGYPSFRAMMEAVRDGQAHYGVLPIENTTAGSINDAYDLLAQMDLSVVGEEVQKVEHCLVALEPMPLQPHPPRVLASAGAGAVLELPVEPDRLPRRGLHRHGDGRAARGREQDLSQAAIASEEAARRYGLTVIKRDIANQKENFTRMMVVAARPEKVDARIAAKTSLIFAHQARARRAARLPECAGRARPQPDQARVAAAPAHALGVPVLRGLRGQHRQTRRCARRSTSCARRPASCACWAPTRGVVPHARRGRRRPPARTRDRARCGHSVPVDARERRAPRRPELATLQRRRHRVRAAGARCWAAPTPCHRRASADPRAARVAARLGAARWRWQAPTRCASRPAPSACSARSGDVRPRQALDAGLEEVAKLAGLAVAPRSRTRPTSIGRAARRLAGGRLARTCRTRRCCARWAASIAR